MKKSVLNGQNVNVNVNVPNDRDDMKSFFAKMWDKVTSTTWFGIFKLITIVVILISSLFAYKALTTEEFVSAMAHKMMTTGNKVEEHGLKIRSDVVTPKIQKELDVLCYTLNADRAFLFELHNGKKNSSGLPFRFADMSYEEPNDERHVERVAMQFQDIPLTLYKYPHYLAQHKYLYGSVSEIATIDDAFADHISRVGGKYLGMIYLTNNGLPLGFLCVSFHEKPEVDEAVVKQNHLLSGMPNLIHQVWSYLFLTAFFTVCVRSFSLFIATRASSLFLRNSSWILSISAERVSKRLQSSSSFCITLSSTPASRPRRWFRFTPDKSSFDFSSWSLKI